MKYNVTTAKQDEKSRSILPFEQIEYKGNAQTEKTNTKTR